MGKKIKKIQVSLIAFFFVLSMGFSGLFGLILNQAAFAANEGLSTVSDKTATINNPLEITDLSITGDGDDNVNIIIYSENGEFNLGSSDNVTTGGFGTNSLTLNGARSDVNAALATLTYTPNELGDSDIKVSLGSNVGNVIIDPDSGRAYTIVHDSLTWNQARTAAKTLEYGGVQGYLANVTSEEEDEFIVANLTGNGWIGASDQGTENDWKWMDGPEADTSFWSGNGVGSGGHPVLGLDDVPIYSNWNSVEPNNSSNEDCAEYIVGEGWNDLNCDGQQRNYVVEFGAGINAPEPVELTFTVTTSVATRNIDSCEELTSLSDDNYLDNINLISDIDCNGETINPLFADDSFEGVFEGNGHTIKNVVIVDPQEEDDETGLISAAYNATFRNITLENFQMTAQDQAGLLLGSGYGNITIDNVHAYNGKITSSSDDEDDDADDIGGLVGELYANNGEEINITDSNFKGSINVIDGSSVGGLIGALDAYYANINIERSYANANINVGSDPERNEYSEQVGGLIGEIYTYAEEGDGGAVTLQDVYSWSKITAINGSDTVLNDAGGLVGATYAGEGSLIKINRAYASGNVEATNNVGGLIGWMSGPYYSGTGYETTNSFAMGKVSVLTDESNHGGLIGYTDESPSDYLTLSNVYYDRTNTDQANCINDTDSFSGCTAVNVANSQPKYFIDNTSNAPLNTWDFDAIWVTNKGVAPTFSPVADKDNDGIDDEIENSAPNNGDGNGDGILDRDQNNVSSLINPINDRYVTLAISEDCALSDVSIDSESSHTAQDDVYNYQSGFVNFTAIGCGEADVNIYHHGVNQNNLSVRKYNPDNKTYFTIQSANVSTLTAPLSGTLISYTIVDNEELDINPVDSVITDPVGLGSLVSSSSAGSPNTGLLQISITYYIVAVIIGLGIIVVFVSIKRAK